MLSQRQHEAEFDRILSQELAGRAKLTELPSIQVQAWRNYERQKFFATGRHPHPAAMGYNLWTDAVTVIPWAFRILTDPAFMKCEGVKSKDAPRIVLAGMATSIGYRYLRGLECLEFRLTGTQRARFERDRNRFRTTWEKNADKAHVENAIGQHPEAVMKCVQLYAAELQSLCPWLERIGEGYGAATLRERAILLVL